MEFHGGVLAGIVSVVFGVLVIVQPKLLAYLVGAYFILIGLVMILANL